MRTNIKLIELSQVDVRQISEELIKRNETETLINKYSPQNYKLNELISLGAQFKNSF